jgi:hypothetical protein
LQKEYVDFCHENNRVEYRSRLKIWQVWYC